MRYFNYKDPAHPPGTDLDYEAFIESVNGRLSSELIDLDAGSYVECRKGKPVILSLADLSNLPDPNHYLQWGEWNALSWSIALFCEAKARQSSPVPILLIPCPDKDPNRVIDTLKQKFESTIEWPSSIAVAQDAVDALNEIGAYIPEVRCPYRCIVEGLNKNTSDHLEQQLERFALFSKPQARWRIKTRLYEVPVLGDKAIRDKAENIEDGRFIVFLRAGEKHSVSLNCEQLKEKTGIRVTKIQVVTEGDDDHWHFVFCIKEPSDKPDSKRFQYIFGRRR